MEDHSRQYVQRPCGKRECEKDRTERRPEGQRRRDQVKLDCKMKEEGKGEARPCRTS